MSKITWMIQRLRAMSAPEVIWRLQQKKLQRKEKRTFKQKVLITDHVFNQSLIGLQINPMRLFINEKNKNYKLTDSIYLLGGYDYKKYEKEWFAGFQTNQQWPLEFSYDLQYKQRDDIGDARTNWELNRHFQFALLAKDYFASGDKKYLEKLIEVFEDWNLKNPFLWGISWTSVMEVAIRCSNWCWMYGFLSLAKDIPDDLFSKIRIGIINMTDYICQHFSRYSSANNHLIVEMYAVGQAGILCDNKAWINLSIRTLTEQLPIQNYSDGVNKELSLHYQSFYMEAMGLMERLMVKNNVPVPSSWNPMFEKMSKYLRDCMGEYGEVVEFGDNDEGKILDLHGGEENHYRYVLGLMSCLLKRRYIEVVDSSENINWIFTDSEIESSNNKSLYKPEGSVCYKEGGNTILRSTDNRVLIGIDHAALGFGSIAAHGHADALSFQMFIDGEPVFVDPGTYIYHCDLKDRNAFRKTENHNTVCVDGKDQSEMLGAFLWGRKAKCDLVTYAEDKERIRLIGKHNGYKPIIHRRFFNFDKKSGNIEIVDELNAICQAENHLVLNPLEEPVCRNNEIRLHKCKIEFESIINTMMSNNEFSSQYGIKKSCKAINIKMKKKKMITRIYVL